MVQVQEICDAIKPAYIYCKIFAICPYTIRGRGERRKLVILKRDAIIVIAQILLILLNCYDFAITLLYSDNLATDVIDNIALFFPDAANCFGLLTNMLFFHIHRKYIVEVFVKVDEIDTLLCSIGCALDYNVIYKKGIMYLITALCFGTCIIVGDIYYCGIRIFPKTSIPIVVEIGIRAILYVFLFDAQFKFSLVNNKLSEFFNNKQSINQHVSIIEDASSVVNESQMKQKNREMAELLQKIVNIHGKLSIHCNKINYLFHVYLIFTISTCFTETVTTIYTQLNMANVEILKILFQISWNLYHLFVIIYTVLNFNNISSEANKTNKLMNKIRYSSLCTDEISALISVHVLRLKHQQVTFTVCRLFPIDNTLLYAMTAGVTTYIVILCQFKNGMHFK